MPVMLHLIAPNSKDGNPRRLYALYGDDCRLVHLWDEGYAGNYAVDEPYQEMAGKADYINITAGEYKRLKKSRGM